MFFRVSQFAHYARADARGLFAAWKKQRWSLEQAQSLLYSFAEILIALNPSQH